MSKRQDKSPPVVMIERSVLDSPAWRAMSHRARSLYLALRRRYNRDYHNNGKIYISVRNAAVEIGSHRDQIGRWYHELEHFGFIVMTCPGNLGFDGKGRALAPHRTRVHEAATNPGFPRWNGVPFHAHKPERPGNQGQSSPGNQQRPKTKPCRFG